MRYHHQSNAPPGSVPPRWAMRVLAVAVLFLLAADPLKAQNVLEKSLDLPDYDIKMWTDVWRPDILMFGRWIQPLGDINEDGYDDIAVASHADTTFIFLGGEEFSHDPVMFLRGGGGGIAAGDFNGDGRKDLATSIVQGMHWLGEPDPEFHGKVRVYLARDPVSMYDTIPDLVIQGQAMESFGILPNSRRPGVLALDYNGDGFDDLLLRRYKTDSIPRLCLAMYPGGSKLDTIPATFFEELWDLPQDTYSDDLMVGDVNRDGKDDVLVHGSYVLTSINRRFNYWELYLGNETFTVGSPDRIISADKGWAPAHSAFSGMSDVNADGCADILDGTAAETGDVQLFLSSRELPDTVLTNDTIPNPDYPWVLYPTCISPVGDMNGDGNPDVLVSWASAFFPLGNLYLLHPGASDGKYKTALGVFGVLRDEHHLDFGAYPLGDVNGDGCDDVAVLGSPGRQSSPVAYRFRIYLGSKSMRTSVTGAGRIVTFEVTIHPNPVRADSGELGIFVNSRQTGTMQLDLIDLLGRSISQRHITDPERQQSVTLPILGLSPGMYSLVVTQGERRFTRPVIVY